MIGLQSLYIFVRVDMHNQKVIELHLQLQQPSPTDMVLPPPPIRDLHPISPLVAAPSGERFCSATTPTTPLPAMRPRQVSLRGEVQIPRPMVPHPPLFPPPTVVEGPPRSSCDAVWHGTGWEQMSPGARLYDRGNRGDYPIIL